MRCAAGSTGADHHHVDLLGSARTNSGSSLVTGGAIHAAGASHPQEMRQVRRIALIFLLRRWEHLLAAPMGNIFTASGCARRAPPPSSAPLSSASGLQHHFRRFPSPSHHRTQTLGLCEIRTVSRCRGELPAGSAESPGNTGQGAAETATDRYVLRSCNATAHSAVEQPYDHLGRGVFGRLIVTSRFAPRSRCTATGVNLGSDYGGYASDGTSTAKIMALRTVGPLRSGRP